MKAQKQVNNNNNMEFSLWKQFYLNTSFHFEADCTWMNNNFIFRNLGNNFFPEMPTKGLDKVVELKTFNNPNLKEFPGPESFPRVRRLVLSYAYHCCQFVSAGYAGTTNTKPFFDQTIEESVLYPTEDRFRNALSELNLTESWPGIGELI